MESRFIPRAKYEDTIKSYIPYNALSKDNKNRNLTLRKRAKNLKTELNIKSKFNLMNEYNYQIHLSLLKTNNDNIRNFFIDLNRPEYTMNNLKYLLESKNDDEVKFGIYAVRTFFQKILREIKEDVHVPEQNQAHPHNNINHNRINNQIIANGLQINHLEEYKIPYSKIDNAKVAKSNYNFSNIFELFLDNNIIHLLFEIIKRCQINNQFRDQINLFESLWILFNMNAVPTDIENSKQKFYSYFTQQDNLSALISLIDSKNYPQEIIFMNLNLLSSLFKENERMKEMVIKSPLPSYLYTYLQSQDNLNKDVLLKIFKLLFELYLDCTEELSIDAYLILFKIFSLSLIIFKSEEIINCSLQMLRMLSEKDIPELIGCFSDTSLLDILNNIIFSRPIENNEIMINIILDIFYNIICKCDQENSDIIQTGIMSNFYNNLLIKYKKDNVTMYYQVEENILVSLNNLIYYNHDKNVEYILGEGIEIMNFFIKSSKSMFAQTRYTGIKSFVNILYNIKIDVKFETIIEMINSIIQALINEFENCYYLCSQCLYLIICRSKEQNYSNDLKNFLLRSGTSDLMEKIKIKLLNDSKNKKISKEEEENFDNFIDNINNFLSED